MDWSKILPIAIGAGATVGGSILQSRAANKSSDAQNALIQSELARRNQLQSAAMPTILRALGYKGGAPSQRPAQPAMGAGGGYGAVSAQPSNLGKILGVGGSIGGAVFGGPIGSAVGGALGFVPDQFGKGRRTANPWVQQNQNPFDSRMKSLADGSPEESAEVQAYQRAIAQMLAGNKQQRAVGSGAQSTAAKYYPGYDWRVG